MCSILSYRYFLNVWDNLEKLAKEGKLAAPRELYRELTKKDDFASKWIKLNQKSIIRNLSENSLEFVTQIQSDFPGLVDPNNPRAQADPFFIALAKEIGGITVTQENPRSKIKIPSVCSKYGIHSINLLDFFRINNWKFVSS